jgi:hypothetical protein
MPVFKVVDRLGGFMRIAPFFMNGKNISTIYEWL